MQDAFASLPYSIRHSDKARRVILRLSRQGELEVVTPRGFDPRRLPEVLARKADWIARTRARLLRESAAAGLAPGLPDAILLRAVNERFSVAYADEAAGKARLAEIPGGVAVTGLGHAPDPDGAARTLLRGWLRAQAARHLPPWLAAVSRRTGLAYAAVRLRSQKSRWGSCSSKKHISLNCKLLFLPPECVEYILVHELCHTRHMNHSPAYWAEVARHSPDMARIDRAMAKAWRYVPLWAD
ncbi:MAG: M48 family metallopeptidase [Desulfovibrionaceae bacterium]